MDKVNADLQYVAMHSDKFKSPRSSPLSAWMKTVKTDGPRLKHNLSQTLLKCGEKIALLSSDELNNEFSSACVSVLTVSSSLKHVQLYESMNTKAII